jgi:hypothetical protein
VIWPLLMQNWHVRGAVRVGLVQSEHVAYAEHAAPHSCVLQASLAMRSSGHAAPVPTCACVTVRARLRRPPPHVTEHVDHIDQLLTTQSSGHGCVLHAKASLSGGQSEALVTMVRVRDCVPPPHDTVHGDHADHCVTEHVQTPRLHDVVSLSASHAVPPLAGGTTTLRVRRDSPGPHICEHAPHEVHALSWQLTGHAAGEHASLSESGGHEAPLHCASVVTVRVCVRVPEPHVTEHDDHVAQLLTTHDTGQQPKPQLAVSESCGHAAPPLAGETVIVRVRVLLAIVPHVAEQAAHAVHSDTSQLIGGGGTRRASTSANHPTSPSTSRRTTLR